MQGVLLEHFPPSFLLASLIKLCKSRDARATGRANVPVRRSHTRATVRARNTTAADCSRTNFAANPIPMARSLQQKWLADCSTIVQSPVDASPIRSPQAVHSTMLQHLANRSIVEVGTRNGDGISCFSHFTAGAVAIEFAPEYCSKLRSRAAILGNSTGWPAFQVRCGNYRAKDVLPDADLYTWWQQPPHLTDRKLLNFLRQAQLRGLIRRTAMALIVSDGSWLPDRHGWWRLESMSSWNENVEFNEQTSCLQRYRRKLCQRAKGTFRLFGVPIANVPQWNLARPAHKASSAYQVSDAQKATDVQKASDSQQVSGAQQVSGEQRTPPARWTPLEQTASPWPASSQPASPQQTFQQSAPQPVVQIDWKSLGAKHAVCLTGLSRSFDEIGANVREGVLTLLGTPAVAFFGVRPPQDPWYQIQRLLPMHAIETQKRCWTAELFNLTTPWMTCDMRGRGDCRKSFLQELCDLQHCDAMIRAAEMRAGRQFQMIVRLRPDTFWESRVTVRADRVKKMTVYVPTAGGLLAVNDHLAIGGRDAMGHYLNRIRHAHKAQSMVGRVEASSEWYLKRSLARDGVEVKKLDHWAYCLHTRKQLMGSQHIRGCIGRVRCRMACASLLCHRVGLKAGSCECFNVSCAVMRRGAAVPSMRYIRAHPLGRLLEYGQFLGTHQGSDQLTEPCIDVSETQLFHGACRRPPCTATCTWPRTPVSGAPVVYSRLDELPPCMFTSHNDASPPGKCVLGTKRAFLWNSSGVFPEWHSEAFRRCSGRNQMVADCDWDNAAPDTPAHKGSHESSVMSLAALARPELDTSQTVETVQGVLKQATFELEHERLRTIAEKERADREKKRADSLDHQLATAMSMATALQDFLRKFHIRVQTR